MSSNGLNLPAIRYQDGKKVCPNAFGYLHRNAVRIFDGGFGCDRAENAMFAAVDLLREDESLRPDFLSRVSDTLSQADVWGTDSGTVPLELIELAIHELRWPEFHQLIETRRSLFPLDTKHIFLTAAFDPDWCDRESYQRYRN